MTGKRTKDEPYSWEALAEAEAARLDELAERRRPWWQNPNAFHAAGCDCPRCTESE
jgi:hypothetical protein